MSSKSRSVVQPKEVGQRLLDARQAAQLLGVGESTFHRHRALGLIGPKAIKLGGSIRWDTVELERWIDAGCPVASSWLAIQEADQQRSSPKGVLRNVAKRL